MTSREQKHVCSCYEFHQYGVCGHNAAPTPVPLEAREWLLDWWYAGKSIRDHISENNQPDADKQCVKLTIGMIVKLLESYSSNAAAMVDYEKQNSVMHNLSEKLEAAESSNAALMEKLANVEKWAVERGNVEPSCKHSIFAMNTECLGCHEKSLNLTLQRIEQLTQSNSAAESRISELERELSTAREALRLARDEMARVPCDGYAGWREAFDAIECVLSPPTKLP